MQFAPAVGDSFAVPGRRDLLTVSRLIASFTADEARDSLYLVQTPAGARWMLVANDRDDGPPWIGRALPAEATTTE